MTRDKRRRSNRRVGKPVLPRPDKPPVKTRARASRLAGEGASAKASTAGVPGANAGPALNFGWAWTLSKIAMGVLVVVGAAGSVAYGAHHFATTTERFAIRVIKVEGSRHYNREELAKKAGAERGSNLFALDLALAEQRLVEDPWIKAASVSRQLPNALKIVVEEYSAAALAAIDGSLYLITRDGHPIKAVESGGHADYPVITGIGPEDLSADRVAAKGRLVEAVKTLRMYERQKLAKAFPAQEIHLSSDGRSTLTVGKQAIALELGKTRYRQKLLMAARIIGQTRSQGETPGMIFLDNQAHPERVVVRLR